VHPDEAVALGAGIQGAILTNTDASEKTKDILLLDIIPLSLGIETKGDIFSKIIEKNSQIPTKKSKMYSTSEDKQTSIHIKVFEGERDFCKDNHKIADFELTDIPKLPRGVPKIEVSFEIDGDGLLSVYACEINTGINNKIIVKNSTKLTQEEINKMIDDAEKYRCKDELKKAALNSKYNYEKYLYQIQKAINDKDYLYDDNGTMIFTEMELISVNNSILSNLEWLLIEDLTKEHIDETRQIFEHNIKGFLNKIYLRKEQLELKLECMEKEKPITSDEAVNYINNNIM
jgi:molecular chaperone DnaK (HSP70)